MSRHVFPVHYRPRAYQGELHQMWGEHRIGVAVFPRQSGKDVAMSMEECRAALQTPKTTGVYVSLNNPMIRDILWDKTYQNPATGEFIQMLQDNVPKHLVAWRDTAMTGFFSNGSRLKLQGYFQSGQDRNGVGTSFQRYNFTELSLFTREDPLPRLMPIIENEHEDRKLRVAATPRGKRNNPLWQLIQTQQHNKEFKVITRTIEDLNKIQVSVGEPPVVSEERLEKIRDAYLRRFGNDRMFEQEYYCSFEEMDAAAVYGEAYSKLLAERRDEPFNLNAGHPLYVAFDIGASGIHSDATSWVAFQWFNGRLFIYDCGEGHGKALPEYVEVLRQKHWFSKLKTIILPWDAEHHEKAINATPADMMRLVFPSVAVLAKSGKVYKIPGSRASDYRIVTDIQQTRLMLYNTLINRENCDWLLECLENYKYEYSHKMQEWSDRPLHDRYSHMMDALRYVVQATQELDFMKGEFYDMGDRSSSGDYEDDWSGLW